MIDYKITVTNKSVAGYKVVEIGDFIISLRSFQGGIEYSNYKGICSPAYIVLRGNHRVHADFYKFYFKTEQYIKLLNLDLQGIRDGKMISYKQFSSIEIPLPSLEEQTKIADFLTAMDMRLDFLETRLEATRRYKQALLQQMLV